MGPKLSCYFCQLLISILVAFVLVLILQKERGGKKPFENEVALIRLLAVSSSSLGKFKSDRMMRCSSIWSLVAQISLTRLVLINAVDLLSPSGLFMRTSSPLLSSTANLLLAAVYQLERDESRKNLDANDP